MAEIPSPPHAPDAAEATISKPTMTGQSSEGLIAAQPESTEYGVAGAASKPEKPGDWQAHHTSPQGAAGDPPVGGPTGGLSRQPAGSASSPVGTGSGGTVPK